MKSKIFKIPLLVTLAYLGFLSCESSEPETSGQICLAVTDGFTFTDSSYHFHITGKIKNFGTQNAQNVIVTAQFYSDPDFRNPVAITNQSLFPIPPNEGYRTFDLWDPQLVLFPLPGGLSSLFYSLTVSGEPGGNEPLPTPEIELYYHQISLDQAGQYHVQGKIINRGPIPAEMVYFTVTFFEDEEKSRVIARLRKGFGRLLGNPSTTNEEDSPSLNYPSYTVDIWHPEITQFRYPRIYYTAEISE